MKCLTKYWKKRAVILPVFILLISFSPRVSAQNPVPEELPHTLRTYLEKFEEYRLTDREKALNYALKAVHEADSLSQPLTNPVLFDLLAENSEFRAYRYSDALRYKQCASDLYRDAKNVTRTARSEADLGRICLKRGDYHKAYSHSIEALEQAQREKDTLTIREARITIEQVEFFYYGDAEKAKEYNNLVSNHYSGAEQARQAVRSLNNRFRYPLAPNETKEIIARCEAICREFGFEQMLVNSYLNAALQELRFNDTEACVRYLQAAEPLISDFKEEGYYYSTRGFYHLYCGETQQAIEDTKRSIELLNHGDFASKNVHSYFLLQELYRSENRYPEAYEALLKFSEVYTGQHNSESIIGLSQFISEMEVQHAREKHARTRQLNTLIIIILVLGVAMLVTGISLFYSKVKLERKNRRLMDQQAEQEIRNKNEIIKVQKLQQFQEQRNLAQLTEELSSAVQSSDDQKMRSEIKRIIRHLQKNSNTAADWVEVERTMAVNNDAFFEKLLKEYPNLTKNERKLCTFIHLNLSTKEISKITHQSMGSINIARARLRQKFGLTGSDQSLIAFLDRFNTTETKENL